ncbi:hypothetical protein GCM10012275_58470 [Longimycelium tulufanense]|uniref:Uncharacterized protein n=1 Tax=Longimycelium tulufanense TaxID=907463 RepID=A0A8J3FXJ3_9PSEU|nr:hypothetical protein GCM10012275_58470 [Longimycelium tulufanense]
MLLRDASMIRPDAVEILFALLTFRLLIAKDVENGQQPAARNLSASWGIRCYRPSVTENGRTTAGSKAPSRRWFAASSPRCRSDEVGGELDRGDARAGKSR